MTAAGTFLRGVLEKIGIEPQVERIGQVRTISFAYCWHKEIN